LNSTTWWDLRNDWTPTTTGNLEPTTMVFVSGDQVNAPIGLRRIVRSTDILQPLSTFTGPSGLKVASYNDAVEAKQIHDTLSMGLLGSEAATTLVRFDLDRTNHTSASWGGTAGSYSGYKATVYSSFLTFSDDGAASLFHEYGHAWTLYYATIVQQDDTLAAYLKARGVYGDTRLGSDVYWQPREMIAEDYRQLFGIPTAAARPQANSAIPPAANVAGLKEWFRDTFTKPPAP
jgi:hypothetical protein